MEKFKKYCHVVFDEYPKDPRVRRYSNALKENDFSIFIVCISNSRSKNFEKLNNEYIYRVPLRKKRSGALRRLFEYSVFQICSTLLVTYIYLVHRVKTFHVHTLPDFLVFSCFIPKLFKSRIILDFHELFPEFMIQHRPSLDYHSALIKILLIQEKIAYKFADNIIVFHDPASNILQERIKSSKVPLVIMNGVDEKEMPVFKPKKSSIFKIIYNGTINYNLNLSIVVKALSVIKKTNPAAYKEIKFSIYGDGPDLNTILEKAAELEVTSVKYEGILRFTELINKIEDASLCIIPPKKDIYSDLFYSIKLIEMIYLKIPVIASRLNTYQLYYPDNCIIYFEPDNETDLAEKIVYVYNNQQNLEQMKINALNQYQNYNWDVMKIRFLNLINLKI